MTHVQEIACTRVHIQSLRKASMLWLGATYNKHAAITLKIDDIVRSCNQLTSPGRYCYFQGARYS
jgi:hypothetical protein